jgi:oxygen-independent coproporphyrinogen-3 oxidase
METSKSEQETKGGNYFISNYPPYSFWSADTVSDAKVTLDKAPNPDTPLGLYIHIPFCRKRCRFCYFKVVTGADSTQVNEMCDTLIAELELYMQLPFIGDRKLDFIYFGGGTPSFLSSAQLVSFTDRLKAILPWDQVKEVAFECEPGTLTEAKLKTIKEIGVTRISLGIENFKDEILEENGRAHRSKEVGRAYAYAKALGFDQINVDLISGMIGETDENWQDCITKVIDLAPESITIYQMEVPFNTAIYREMKSGDSDVAPVASWPTKRRWVDEAFLKLEANGYSIGSAYTAVKDKEKTKFVYRDRLWQGADMIALGVAAFSHIGGKHFQNEKDLDLHKASVSRGEIPIARAFEPTEEERMIREFILQLKLGKISTSYFLDKYSIDVIKYFETPLNLHRENQMLDYNDNEITLSRDGLLQVDRLLPEFYLLKHKNARYT